MEEHEEINYKTLRRLQQAEQASSVLTKISMNFYQDLSLYLKTLERSIENEENPLKIKLFTEELQNTKKIAHNIYELREKKMVQAALATARGASLDMTNFLEVEQQLYTRLVGQIRDARRGIFEQSIEQPTKKQTDHDSHTPSKRESHENPIVRVLEDTPEFVGTDGKAYSLRKEDVMTIPSEMSEPLLKKKIVKQIK